MKTVPSLAEGLFTDGQLETGELLERHPELRAKLEATLEASRQRWLDAALVFIPPADMLRVTRQVSACRPFGAELRRAVEGALTCQEASSKARRRVRAILSDLDMAGAFDDPFGMRRRASEHPWIRPLAQATALVDVGKVTSIEPRELERAVAAGLRADRLSGRELERSIGAGQLGRDTARALGLAADLLGATGDAGPATRLAGVALPTGKPRHVRDFAVLSRAAWRKVAADNQLGAAAEKLRANLETVFAGEAIVAELSVPAADLVARDLDAAAAALAKSPGILTDARARALEPALERLRALVRRFPRLELASIFGELDAPAADRARRAVAKMGALGRLSGASSGEALFDLDLSAGSEALRRLASGSLEAGELAGVAASLEGYRSLHRITQDVGATIAVLDAGYPTHVAIATTPRRRFEKAAGLATPVAKSIHEKARRALRSVTAPTGVVLEVAGNGFIPFRGANNVDSAVEDDVRGRPELAELIGRLDHCRCEECQSLLGPSAYYVDLMGFVAEHVLDDASYLPSADPYHLRFRRPDLWKVRLDCDAVDGTLPTLDLVNDVLERYLAAGPDEPASGDSICGKPDALDAAARAERERAVYGTRLAAALAPSGGDAGSVRQPFFLPQVEVDLLLAAAGGDRAALVRELGARGPALDAAELGTTQTELVLLRSDAIAAARLFGPEASSFAARPPDSAWLADRLRVSREELAEVLATRFVGGDTVAVALRTVTTEDALQPNREVVDGLTIAVLGRLHRFVRLWRLTKAGVAELDLLLGALFDAAHGAVAWSDLLATGLPGLSALRRIQLERSVAPDEVAALVGTLPARALGAERPLLERRFGELARGSYTHPRWAGSPPGADSITRTAQLAGGCGVGVDVLGDLIAQLRPRLQPAGDDPSVAIDLSNENLAVLYRHARLLALLGVSVAELFALLALRERSHVAGVADLELLFETHARWKAWGLSLPAMSWLIVAGQPDIDVPQVTDGIVRRCVAEDPLSIAPTLLALAPDIGPALSERLVETSPAFFHDPVSGQVRLADGYDPGAALPLPAELVLSVDERAALERGAGQIAALLRPHTLATAVPGLLAGPLGLTARQVELLAAMAGVDLGNASLVPELLGRVEPVGLRERVTAIARLGVVLGRWSEAALELLQSHPDSVGLGAGAALDWDASVRLLWLGRFFDVQDRARREARQAVVDAYSASVGISAVPDATLEAAFGAAAATVRAADAAVARSPHAASQLAAVSSWLEATARVGLEVPVLAGLTSPYSSWDAEYDAMVVVRDALRARAGSADGANAIKIERVDSALRGRRRDALREHLLVTEPERFPRASSLYHYFLIDTDIEGCAKTSCVVAATASLQLFVQRVLLGLEGSPTHTVDPDLVPKERWAWRRAFRMWQANRDIFCHPENFLLPELRDDKTPLFEVLEETLLSAEPTPQRILDAYAAYAAGLDELARLSIAGSYHHLDTAQGRDELHLFGVNSESPPVYYHRRIDDLHHAALEPMSRGVVYGPWRRIEVKIPVRVVAPKIVSGRLCLFWVESRTQNDTDVEGGTSRFVGYKHKLALRYSSLRLDGTWTPAQDVSLDDPVFEDGAGVVLDRLARPVAGTPTGDSLQGMERLVSAMVAMADSVTRAEARTLVVEAAGRHMDLIGPIYSVLLGAPTSDDDVIALARIILQRLGEDPDEPEDGVQFGVYVAERDGASPPRFHGRGGGKPHPRDDYALDGYLWDRVLPDQGTTAVTISMAAFRVSERRLDLYRRAFAAPLATGSSPLWTGGGLGGLGGLGFLLFMEPLPAVLTLDGLALRGVRASFQGPFGVAFNPLAWATTWSSRDRFRRLAYEKDRNDVGDWTSAYTDQLDPGVPLLTLKRNGTLEPCGGLVQNAVLDIDGDHLLLLGAQWQGEDYQLRRLGSTLASQIGERLFTGGVDGLLSTEHQLGLAEGPAQLEHAAAGADISRLIFDRTSDGTLDYTGPFGAYYRELFFHIPFALACSHHARGDYASAQRWLHFVFDPGGAPLDGDRVPLDRVWRYRELRGLTVETLRSRLSDPAALAAYEIDPFNPHAIARLRLTAYQNAVVMKYLDVLLDWGDSLFAEFTRESVNEATLLYVLASDLLGDRPTPVGECLDGAIGSYDEVVAAMGGALEAVHTAHAALTSEPTATGPKRSKEIMVSLGSVSDGATSEDAGSGMVKLDWNHARREGPTVSPRGPIPRLGPLSLSDLLERADDQLTGLARQMGTFCVPPNTKLLAYWDRVADRLFKIRNCLDLQGQRRELPLFAPRIDPLLLARMRAAGLSLDDVLAGAMREVPPYRFRVLVQHARAAAGAVQGLGGALLSALEKRDSEQLAQLRNRHAQNLTRLGTRALEIEVESAGVARASAEAALASAEHRQAYYQRLLDEGLNASEQTQQTSSNLSLTLKVQASYWELIAGVAHLVPELGSPFALKFGGKQVGDAAGAVAGAFRTLSGITDAVAQSSAVEASFRRREQSWRHELEVSTQALAQQKLGLEAAVLREEIAKHRLVAHEESLAQAEEVQEFFEDKLTSYGLYDWHATTLTRLYRNAFESAMVMARLAERAYAFERVSDDTRLSHDYWDASHRGLLAGERLMADLQRLEQRFVETDARSLEVDQTFALSQVDPDALWRLKSTGECTFSLSERFFDLAYPGHYRRRIKAIRVTLPALVGQHTNIAATLELTGSRCRVEAGDAEPTDMPAHHSTHIATSRASNDGGVFELSFNDSRYLPFEGAGAVSDWRLRLPATFRSFDYHGIDDVLIHMAYTAQHDETLRAGKEVANEALRSTIVARLGDQPFVRIVSFRHELGPVLRRLNDSPAGTAIPFSLKREHLPFYLRDLPLTVAGAALFVRGAAADVSVVLDGTPLSGFAVVDGEAGLAGALPHRDATAALGTSWLGDHTIAFSGAGRAEDILLATVLGLPA